MKNLPEDDERLVDFLRKHRPDIPPAAPDLEETIFQVVESSATNTYPLSKSNPTWFRQLWLVPPAIAATVVLALNSDTLRSNTLPKLAHLDTANSLSQIESLKLKAWNSPNQKSHHLNDEELLYLEAYLENNWNGVVANSHPEMEVEPIEAEYLSLANSTSHHSIKSAKLSTTRR